jgi:uncharacterized protein (DUF2147 family)
MADLKKISMRVMMLTVVLTALHSFVFAQSEKIEGIWLNEEKDAKIQIYKAVNGKYYGKIVWLKVPLKDGKPKSDENNPEDNLKAQPLINLVILKGFEKDGDKYSEGTIYDPKNGKTYDCKMTFNGKTLAIRGYIGISLFGRTTVWEKSQS